MFFQLLLELLKLFKNCLLYILDAVYCDEFVEYVFSQYEYVFKIIEKYVRSEITKYIRIPSTFKNKLIDIMTIHLCMTYFLKNNFFFIPLDWCF